ncbi:twin-arginine translocation signal domain-containing protein, partial [Testudinibacter sp. TR-2022]
MEKNSKNDPGFATSRRSLLKGGAALSGIALAASAVPLPVSAGGRDTVTVGSKA